MIMPDIGKVLKDEIARIAKREAKGLLAAHIKAIRGLKREVAALKKQVPAPANVKKALAAEAPLEQSPGRKVWFTGKGVKGIRARLGLSQAAFAKLCGVSSNAVWLWETAEPGKLNLRTATRETLLNVRLMSPAAAKRALGSSSPHP